MKHTAPVLALAAAVAAAPALAGGLGALFRAASHVDDAARVGAKAATHADDAARAGAKGASHVDDGAAGAAHLDDSHLKAGAEADGDAAKAAKEGDDPDVLGTAIDLGGAAVEAAGDDDQDKASAKPTKASLLNDEKAKHRRRQQLLTELDVYGRDDAALATQLLRIRNKEHVRHTRRLAILGVKP